MAVFPQGRATDYHYNKKLIGDEKDPIYRFMSLPEDVKKGTHILLDDGNLEFVVEKVDDDQVFCQVITGGELKDNKGMNLPGAKLNVERAHRKGSCGS